MIERVLELGSTETPYCRCGTDMLLSRTEAKAEDTLLKIFHCPNCHHELRLMVWCDEAPVAGAA